MTPAGRRDLPYPERAAIEPGRVAGNGVPARAGFAWALGLVLLLGLVVRIAAARGDVWLDEIWSLRWARWTEGAWDVLTSPAFHHDNNHPLNTWFLLAVGPGAPSLAYRLLAILGGLVAIAAGMSAVRARGMAAVLSVGFVLALSFLLVVYSSEARGYGTAMAAGLLSYAALARFLARGGWAARLCFWGAALVGLLSHLTFLHAWLGAAAWSAWVLARDGRRGFGRWLGLHSLPLSALAAMGWLFYRDLRFGGGPPFDWSEVLSQTLVWSLGGPQDGRWAVALAVLLALLIALDASRLVREERGEWVFFLVVLVLAPLLTAWLFRPEYLFPRYFLVCTTFALLAAARAVGSLWVVGGRARVLAALLLAGFAAGNARHLVPFLRVGRGQYRAAVEYMRANTASPRMLVASDHDFRVGLVLEHHGRELPPERPLCYVEKEQVPPQGVRWWIAHGLEPDASFPPEQTWQGQDYRRERVFRHAGPSGMTWALYRVVRE